MAQEGDNALPRSIARANNWMEPYEALFVRKFGGRSLIFSQDRQPYWKFLVKGVDKIKSDPDPVTRLLCLVPIAKHANNCGMLPPRGASNMASHVSQMMGGGNMNMNFGGAASSPTDNSIDDTKIPKEISRAIQDLPSTIHEDLVVRNYLKVHAFSSLRQNNHQVGDWIKRELDYWEKDFSALASDLATKLHLTDEEYEVQRVADAQQKEERDNARSASMAAMKQRVMNGEFDSFLK